MPISSASHDTFPLVSPTIEASSVAPSQQFVSLELETRSHVDTNCAAFHLMRKPQTLRAYACLEKGNIRPVRINGRLAWSVSDIKRLLSGSAQ